MQMSRGAEIPELHIHELRQHSEGILETTLFRDMWRSLIIGSLGSHAL